MKVRKTLDAWPLTFKAGAEYDRVRNELNATAECRDAFLGGEFSVDVLHKAVEYKLKNHKASETKAKLDNLFK